MKKGKWILHIEEIQNKSSAVHKVDNGDHRSIEPDKFDTKAVQPIKVKAWWRFELRSDRDLSESCGM